MPRKRTGFHQTIEYIGPQPQKKKRRHFFGGWVILVIAAGVATWFGRPLVPVLKANQQGASIEQAELTIERLRQDGAFPLLLAAHALILSGQEIQFDNSYYQISYPEGDIAPDRGNAADVVVRCFRAMGIDLQRELHEDMKHHFRLYPQLWEAITPDANIDHRRVPNLERFFERHGESLAPSYETANFRHGDIVVWSLANAEKHIGIIVPGPGARASEPWVVHHLNGRIEWADALFDYTVVSHFRYPSDMQR
ncbi:MAG: DUF1287 domain-containing protein [Luteolibacter sp.]